MRAAGGVVSDASGCRAGRGAVAGLVSLALAVEVGIKQGVAGSARVHAPAVRARELKEGKLAQSAGELLHIARVGQLRRAHEALLRQADAERRAAGHRTRRARIDTLAARASRRKLKALPNRRTLGKKKGGKKERKKKRKRKKRKK